MISNIWWYVGTSLIVEWLNVKIQTRNGGSSPSSNGNTDKNSYSVHGEETYRFQVSAFNDYVTTIEFG